MSRLRCIVRNQFIVEIVELDSHIRIGRSQRAKRRGTDMHRVLKGAGSGLRFRIDAMTHGSALHEDDRMVAVLACDGGGQPRDKLRLCTANYLLEAVGRQMMALIHDKVTVFRHLIADVALTHQTLNDGDVQRARRLLSAAANPAYRLWRQAEKRRQSFHPLFQQLAAMYEDQRIDAALCNEPCGNDRLSKGGRGRQNTRVMGQHGIGCGLLLGPQFAMERHIQRFARHTVRRERRRRCPSPTVA